MLCSIIILCAVFLCVFTCMLSISTDSDTQDIISHLSFLFNYMHSSRTLMHCDRSQLNPKTIRYPMIGLHFNDLDKLQASKQEDRFHF